MAKPDFSPKMRAFQDQFETRKLSDMIARHVFHEELSGEDQTFIQEARFFFLATTDANGQPQCSYKGGPKGFVQITGPSELVFPFYEGNGMYISAGNIADTARVGLLFIDFEGQSRMRINGTARIIKAHKSMDGVVAAQQLVQVMITDIHPNCMRNVHKMSFVETSSYTPENHSEDVGKAPWGETFKDVLPDNMKPEGME